MKTANFTSVGSTFIVVHADMPPSDEDWDGMIKYSLGMASSPRGLTGVLVHAHLSLPTSAQRERLVKSGIPVRPQAILTSSGLVRGASTCLAWLGMGKHIKTFAPSKLDEALGYLAVPVLERRQVLAALSKLKLELVGDIQAPSVRDEAVDRAILNERLKSIQARMMTK